MNEHSLPKWWVCFFNNVCNIQDEAYCPDMAASHCCGFLQALYDCNIVSEEQGMCLYRIVKDIHNESKYKNF